MDFATANTTESFRAEVRSFLREHLTEDVRTRMRETGTMHDWGFHRAMAARGWIGAGWPVEEGGQARDAYELDVLYQEMAAAGAPLDGFSVTMIVAETLRRIGTPYLRELILPRVRAGDLVISLGYSEPDAGSDLVSVRTSARREGDEWVIDGQKAFTTLAHEAGYIFLLARTDPEAAPRHGLTMFLVPTDSPGFSLTPIHTLGGERTNMTFYSGVRIPDALRVSDVGKGWDTVNLALSFERGGEFGAQLRRLLEDVVAWVAAHPDRQHARNLERIGRLAAEVNVARLLGLRATWLRDTESTGALEGAMAKVHATEALLAASGEVLEALGVDGAVAEPALAPLGGHVEHTYRHAQVTTIYGGTSEILRGVIAERRLGLPRSRPPRHAPSGR
jgi:alkylation response protein AidB-like acyl-CoA dehydrogenase